MRAVLPASSAMEVSLMWGIGCDVAISRGRREFGQAVVQHDDVALQHAGAEGRAPRALLPYLGAYGLAREHRAGEADVEAREAGRVVAAQGLQQRARRHAVGAQAMQDRALEA